MSAALLRSTATTMRLHIPVSWSNRLVEQFANALDQPRESGSAWKVVDGSRQPADYGYCEIELTL